MNRPKSRKPGHPSERYVQAARSIEGKAWKSPHAYVEGVSVVWAGVTLVCTRGHYAGDAAWHPWDPGDGWPPEHAATLWAPNGERQADRLAVVIEAIVRQVRDGADVGTYCNAPLLEREGAREEACERLEAIARELCD